MTQRLGVLPVDFKALEDVLFFPRGYAIESISVDAGNHTLWLTVSSESFPEAKEGEKLPTIQALVHVDILPDTDPAYRKVMAEYTVKK